MRKYNGYKVMCKINSEARTVAGINSAIERETGIKDYLEDKDNLDKAIKEGWLKLTATQIVVYEEIC